MAEAMLQRMVLPCALAAIAAASCAEDYTCCAQIGFYIPIGQTCVENEPSGADNCARNHQSKVPAWARAETKEWLLHGVCNSSDPVVTRAQIEAREKKEHEFQANYEKYCIKNAANCSATETCFFDKVRLNGKGGEVVSGFITDMGPACVCQFVTVESAIKEYARAKPDGTGACVECAAGPNGAQPFVQRPAGSPEGPGAKQFHNGEFACAFGPKLPTTERNQDTNIII